jgi:2-methylcitrate dehydratase PrpD
MESSKPADQKLSVVARGATRKLAEFVAAMKYTDLPTQVVEHTKLLALDAIGCCLYGSTLPWTRRLIEVIREEGGAERSSVIGAGFRTSPSQAVLANSTAGHAFECDDMHKASLFHPGSICLPVALACAEGEGGRNGRDVITSMVAGYEVGPRVGMAGTMGLFFRGWHPQGTSGTFVSAASASRMLGLNADQTQDAIGIAATQASGLMSAQEGAMVKRMHSGRAAQSGVYGGLLARKGFTGIKDVLEADFGGFLSTMSATHDPARLTQGLGKEWETLVVGFKPFSSVASIHAALDALRQIMQSNKLKGEDVEAIEARVGTMTHVHCAWEYKAQGVTAAQMNIFFGLAAIAVDGDAFIHQYREDRLRDQRLLDMIGRTQCLIDPEIDAMGPLFRHAARVTVRTKDGRSLSKEMLHRLGSPENPLTAQQVYDKFRTLAGYCLSADKVDAVMAMVQGLDKLDDVTKLTSILGAASAK